MLGPILSHIYKPKPLLFFKRTVSFPSFNPQSKGEVEPTRCTVDCKSSTQQDGAFKLNLCYVIFCNCKLRSHGAKNVVRKGEPDFVSRRLHGRNRSFCT